MGIFDFFKGKKADEPQPAPKNEEKKNFFLTNMEEFGFAKCELEISGKLRVDAILAIVKFKDQAEKNGVQFSYSVMYVSLLEDGALTVPLVINYGDKAYSVYFIYNEEDLLKYTDLQDHVTKTAYPNLIYFSSIPVYKVSEPKKIIEPFQLADLRHEKEPKISGKFAMWSNNGNETFGSSVTLDLLTNLYEVYKGYETYLFGYVIRQTRFSESTDLSRMSLPESPVNFVLSGPENKMIVLDISQERGIRFLFPLEDTSKTYRERFLKGVLVDFLSIRMYLEKNNVDQDEVNDPNSYDWFKFMSDSTIKMESQGEKIELVGGFEINGAS